MIGRVLKTTEQPRREQDRAALALAAAGVGEFDWDIPGDTIVVSSRMAAITGVRMGGAPARRGAVLFDHVHAEEAETLRAAFVEGLRGQGRHEAQLRFIRPDSGVLVWLEARAVSVRSTQGDILRVVGVVRDISAIKGEASQRDALVAELDHRVKNVLASVQSLAAQSARRTVSLEAFLKTFFGRLEAMASAHTLLTATRWRGAEISQIAAAELGGLAQGQAYWEGPDIMLNSRATHALTLALHELGANAVKHGALSTEAGRVDVKWLPGNRGGFELVWTEKDGPIVAQPIRRGFGSTLLERVTGRELGGSATFEFRPEGLRAVLIADATALAIPRPDEPVPPPLEAQGLAPVNSPVGASSVGLADSDIQSVRVLIVEDAVLLGLELESGLAECGAVVVGLAADLDEAFRMIELDFDVAVLDANLNGRSVIPVAEALAGRGAPFIFATGYGDAGAAPTGFDVPVVRKPYNVRQIAAALVEALAARAASRQVFPA